MKIYILEDDKDQSELYSFWLEDYECQGYDKARDLIKHIPFEVPDILLIDWNLPKVDGLDVLHWLKGSRYESIPVIFLTSRNTEDDIVRALTDGADDYIVKPVSEAILKARIKAVTRRLQNQVVSNDDSFTSSPYQFNHKSNTISYKNTNVSLTNKEYDLALYFFKNEGLLISRDQLLESIWVKSSEVSTRTVDTHISRLRKKLLLNGTYGWKLISIYHQGYKLINQNNE
ncbi:MAG TPA: response regulator transcription factor [Oceanospirillales bacterium]|nr:response regulator transcription factor [Oceanospirillales bacterium]